ncbi:acyloxyacyl hydrolase [Pusillimonas caeni]|uniref:acyloxyacyl hydrolase n=1 Tax=Pusillimonas caeni TaxID=1348472 RepID=UPI000E59BED6|nr:acyloxyacyl hydrolase [Pusillimonas caeni]TFL15443.1 acyloxyacyl hydrolase [Pusillimonas caeni]
MRTRHASMRVARIAPPSILAVALALALPAAPAWSQTAAHAPTPGQGFSLQYGYHAKYQRFGLAYETPSLWRHDFANDSHIDLGVEFGAGYWKADNRDPDSMWQVAVVPVLRWWPQDTYYLELGVGPSLLSRAHFAGKELSTRFQFTSHIGGGFVINDVHRFGVRYTHVSNASIKRPNPGLDLIEASYTYQF